MMFAVATIILAVHVAAHSTKTSIRECSTVDGQVQIKVWNQRQDTEDGTGLSCSFSNNEYTAAPLQNLIWRLNSAHVHTDIFSYTLTNGSYDANTDFVKESSVCITSHAGSSKLGISDDMMNLISNMETEYNIECTVALQDGNTCSHRILDAFKEYTAATFGQNGESSAAEFSLSQWLTPTPTSQVDVSFHLRTTAKDGLLIYLGSDPTDFSVFADMSHVSARLMDGHLVIQLKSAGTLQAFRNISSGVTLTDGNQHHIFIHCLFNTMQVSIDELPLMTFSLDVSLMFSTQRLFIGSVDGVDRMGAWDADALYSPWDTPHFRGTLQDLRLNGNSMEFFPAIGTTDVYKAALVLHHVRSGEQTDDICGQQTPCGNGAECFNVFFNNFRCECAPVWKGPTCTELDYCTVPFIPYGRWTPLTRQVLHGDHITLTCQHGYYVDNARADGQQNMTVTCHHGMFTDTVPSCTSDNVIGSQNDVHVHNGTLV